MRKSEPLTLENLEHLAHVVNFCKNLPENATAEKTIKTFFLAALCPFFGESEHSGIDIRMGHFLYRLSEFLSEERRKSFEIYPALEHGGSLVIEGCRWYSLEDWRRMWEEKNGGHPIPIINLAKKFCLAD